MPSRSDSYIKRPILLTVMISLLLLLTVALSAPPLAAEQLNPTVAVIVFDTQFLDARDGLKRGLEQLGYTEPVNIDFLTYNLKKDLSQIPVIIDELHRRSCDLVVTTTTPVTLAVKKTLEKTSPIPVVFTMVADPLKSRIVTSMTKPAGFITGIAYNAFKIMPKKLELFHDAFPQVKKLAIFYNHHEEWLSQPVETYLLPAAQQLQFDIVSYHICNHTEFDTVIETFEPDIDGIFMVPDPFTISAFGDLVELSHQHKIPLMVIDNSQLSKGGVIGYSPTFFTVGQQAATIAAKILAGTPAGKLAVQTTRHNQLAVSLREADALDITISDSFLRRCDLILR